VLGKDVDIGALVGLLFRNWDLEPLPPKNRARYREAAAELERQILTRAQRSEVPCIRDQFELARVYLRLGQDSKAGACYRVFLGLLGK
jgi:hypothetical protein